MLRALGLPDHAFDGRPIIGICSMWSELNPCDAGQKDLAQHVRAGVLEAGGLPLEFPGFPVGEPLMRPSPLMYRNLASMAIEETLRSNPLDGVVMLAGCDKTTPAMLMAAASCDLPCVLVSSGPKMSGKFRGQAIGSGTHIWMIEEQLGSKSLPAKERAASESAMSRGIGTCNTMGTASTMAAVAEVMGIALAYNASIPAPDARRLVLARSAGATAVDAVKADRRPSKILTLAAFDNAVRVVGALGGSTNAVIHLLALARRLEIAFTLDDWDRLGTNIPCLVDLMPSGTFLMEDFDSAGGLPVVLQRLYEHGLLDGAAPTITGEPLSARLDGVECFDDRVIRRFENPVVAQGGLAVVRGSLAPDGAVIKPSAATPSLLRHRARAIVFDSIEDFWQRIDDPALDVEPNSILVLRNCGPRGYPGMPEVGNFKLPHKILQQGVTDMVRISDARMSGTAFGTIVLHVAPESAVGGPLSLIRTGDVVDLDVDARRIDLLTSSEELDERRAQMAPVVRVPARGYERLYVDHVMQANLGADFDFMAGGSGSSIPKPST
jgi:dihydroxy-acid dehydratase